MARRLSCLNRDLLCVEQLTLFADILCAGQLRSQRLCIGLLWNSDSLSCCNPNYKPHIYIAEAKQLAASKLGVNAMCSCLILQAAQQTDAL